MKKWNRILSLLLALVLVIGIVPVSAMAKVAEEPAAQAESTSADDVDLYSGPERLQAIRENWPQQAGEAVEVASASGEGLTVTPVADPQLDVKEASDETQDLYTTVYAADEVVRVMVVLEEPSLLEQGYSKSEIAASTTAVTKETQSMEAQQDAVVAKIQSIVDGMTSDVSTFSLDEAETVEVNYHYSVALNGVAVEMPYGALEDVRKLDGVASAFVVPTYSLPEDMSDGSDPNTYATKNSFGSAMTWEALGYTGAGMRVAIIDTGLDTDHPSFVGSPELTETSLTQEEIAGVLENLNAYERYSQKSAVKLTAANLYRTEKIAYGFNYVDNDLDITHNNDLQGDHGTHVAGIAASNQTEGTEVAGVAPDAQLLIMKVFGKAGGAYFDDIVAALEDCFWLDVDAVNLSLGSPAGFTVSDESSAEFNQWSDEVYARIEESDMIASISAGNSGSAAAGNGLGTDRNLSADPDNGIVSSPATYPGATVVASIENESVMCNYILVDGQQVPFNDVGALPFTNLAGEHEYVMVPGYGTADDFAQVDVSGKIAVVSRGELAFTDKQTNAYDAGAIGCIVYDNVEGDLINMQDAGILPSAFVSKASGELLAGGSGTLEVLPAEERMIIPSSLAGQMSDFSSWGVTPNLELVPDITAPGGNIYSTLDGGIYGTMSGTSMSAPHITGMAALVLQYLHDVYPDHTDSWYHTVAEALIMSTAEPVVEPTGVLYSPRKQGAGSANVYSAVSSPAYLTVNGSTPKVSFGDDDQKNGVYTFSFEINNLSGEDAAYVLSGSALTDQVDVIGNLLYLMGETSRNLDAKLTFSVGGVEIDGSTVSAAGKLPYDANKDGDVDLDDVQYMLDSVNGLKPALPDDPFDINLDGKQDTADAQRLYELLRALPATGDGVVTVPAGETVTVDVTVTLSSADKAYMNKYYPNGIYVDGFVRCYAIGGTSDLSLPFLGFYGDWSAARIFDDTAWYYLDNPTVNRYYNVLWTEDGQWILGDNPYLYESYDPGHNVLSPNGDGYQEAISQMYLGLMRNAKKLTFTWEDENGNVLMETSADYIRKSYYVSTYGICYPFIYSGYVEDYYDFLDENGECAHEDLERLSLTVEGYLDDGDDVVDDSFVVPLVIDTTAPVLDAESMEYVTTADGSRKLVFNVSDNYDIAAVVTLTLAGDVIEAIPVTTKLAGVDGEEDTITLDVSKYDADFYVVVCDYGYNESYYQVSFSGKHNVDTDAFYGYRRTCVIPYNGYLYITDAYSGWHSFTDPTDLLMHTSLYSMGETAVSAADYVDGYVIGIDDLGSIFAMASGTWTRNEFGTMGDYPQALDMAYDFSTGTMYVLTDEHAAGEGGYLLELDILTGELTEVGKVTGIDSATAQGVTLACDNEGVLYTIDYSTGDLYTLNKETAVASRVGATGYKPVYMQSMTVDHSTDTLYWAAYANYDGVSSFFEVDKATGELTKVDDTELNSQLTALFKPYVTGEDRIPDEASLTGLKLSAESLSMAVGNVIALTCQPIPYYAELGNVTWTSSDDAVATVENGVVTGVGEGAAEITASAQGKSVRCTVKVTPIQADLVSYDAGNSYMWLNYDAAEPQNAVTLDDAKQPNGYYDAFLSAAYTDGSVYAFDSAGGFYKLDADTMQGIRLGTNSNVNGSSGYMLALAFNYADGYLYGITQTGSFWSVYFDLVRINPTNGQFEVVDRFDADTYGQPMNLAVDLDGNFYSVVAAFDYDTWEATIKLVSFQLEDGKIANISADLSVEGAEAGYGNFNSLVYSYENEGLFWADEFGQLLWIDPATGESVNLGNIGSTADYYPMNVCLFERPKNDPDVSYAKPESVTMAESFLLLEGSSVPTNVTVEPWNAKATLNYSIADEDIATVDSTGVITGLKAGRTSLQVLVSETGQSLEATVTVAQSAGNLYGSVVTDFLYGSNFWVKVPDATPGEAELIHDSYDEDFQPFAGAYYDGSLYAYCQDSWGANNYKYYLLKYNLTDYSAEILGQVHVNIRDMEFDYTTGTMFAIVEDGKAVCALAQVNLETAEVAIVGDTGFKMAAMTVDKNGTIYAISESGSLYTLNKSTGEAKLVGSTGVAMNDGRLYQSMHCDLDTGNVYWAQAARDYSNGLYLVDVRTGAATNLGAVGTGAEVACLYTVPETEPTIPAIVLPTGVSLNEKATVVVGETVSLNATVLPFSVASVDQTLTWSSSDEAVATVENGVVTGASAGTALITATTANGKSASCLVTVTAEARRFYAYDETNYQWISFSAEDTTDVTVERADNSDEARIMASVYVDDQLYSYTDDGLFWSIDTESFERAYVGKGVSELTIEATVYDWWSGGSYTVEVPVTPYDLSYDEATGMTYGLFMAEDYDNWVFVTVIGEVDLETGEVHVILQSEEIQPGNLLVKNGRAYFVDTYYSGILKYIDLYAEAPEATDIALVYNYWGDFTGGRSFLEDPLTGTIYAIRDNRGYESSLWTLNLGDADVQSLGMIGEEGIVANSLFIK